MALKKLKWLKFLFVDRLAAEAEQNYWNEKRKKHLANEHSEGVVLGLAVTEKSPPSLTVEVAAGRAVDTDGNDPDVESVQEIDCTSLVPPSGETVVYITLQYNTVETDPYFVEETGANQNKFILDSFLLEATTVAPSAPALELARFRLGTGATAITDAADPANPGLNEIDFRQVKFSGKEVLALKDLSDVNPNEADAFNNMTGPSASNPIATINDVVGSVAPVIAEVVDARGTQPSLDARLDVVLNEDGSFKGITQVSPSAPLTGGGTSGNVPIGIDDATPAARGAMAAADKAKLDGIEAGATGDQTAAELLTAIKTVDGAGSGLDADLLDGSQHRGLGAGEHALATPSANGFMSAGDKGRLDNLALADLADVSADEAAAFNNANTPSASNPLATVADVSGALAGSSVLRNLRLKIAAASITLQQGIEITLRDTPIGAAPAKTLFLTLGSTLTLNPTGLASDSWYYVYVIGDTTNVNGPQLLVDLLNFTDNSALPAGFDVFRRIGTAHNDGAFNFLPALNKDGITYYLDQHNFLVSTQGGPIVGSFVVFSTGSPLSFIPPTSTRGIFLGTVTGAGDFGRTDWFAAHPDVIATGGTGKQVITREGTSKNASDDNEFICDLDSLQQIAIRRNATDAISTTNFHTVGYVETL